MSAKKKETPKKKPDQVIPEGGKATLDLSVNSHEDWEAIRKSWSQVQAEKMQAKTERFFVTDEDLPLSRHLILVTIFALFISFIAWASFAELDEVTRGFGKIIPSSELQEVASLEAGIVEDFFVTKGERVKEGQLLVRLRDVAASSDLETNRSRYLGLRATVTRLQAEVDQSDTISFPPEVQSGVPDSVQEELKTFQANKRRMREQRKVLEQQLIQRKQEIIELSTRISDIKQVIALSRQEKAMIEPLVARGSAPKIELVQLQRGIREQVTELNSLKKSAPRAKASAAEAQSRIDELDSSAHADAQRELSEKTIEVNSLKEMLSALVDRKEQTEIISPVNGIVHDITVHTKGGVVQAGQPIVQIVPEGEPLFVEAKIKPSDIAFLRPSIADRPGQKAMVKITAYDFSIYGGLDGVLVSISPDTITDEQGETFYRVRIKTDQTELVRKGEVLPITTGMEAQVDILTGKKTVMEYLLKPFVKTLNQSLSER